MKKRISNKKNCILKSEGNVETKVSNPTRTRSLRQQNLSNIDLQLINCHACKTVDSSNNMITCCKLECRESFCINCIKKNYIKFNSNFFLILKEKETSNSWKCYKCLGKCKCKDCDKSVKGKKRKYEKKMLKIKRGRSEGKPKSQSRDPSLNQSRNQSLTQSRNQSQNQKNILKRVPMKRGRKKIMKPEMEIQIVSDKIEELVLPKDDMKIREKIQIDEFCILECESSDDNIDEEEGCQESNNDSFIEDIKEESKKEMDIIKSLQDSNNKICSTQPSSINKENAVKLSLFNDKNQSHDDLKLFNQNINNNLNEFGSNMNSSNFDNLFMIIFSLVNRNRAQFNSLLSNNISVPNFDLSNFNNFGSNFFNNDPFKFEHQANNSLHDKKVEIKENSGKQINLQNENKEEIVANSSLSQIVNNYNNNLNIYINNTSNISNNSQNPQQQSQLQQHIPNTPNKKPLTKPCYVCGHSHFNRTEILKFPNYKLLISTLRNLISQRETMSDTDMTNLRNSLNFHNLKKNDENFEKNKKLLDDFCSIIESKSEEKFRRTKRICKKCLYINLERDNGISLIFNSVQEEDEQPTLDAEKKEEIIKNIKEFFSVTGYSLANYKLEEPVLSSKSSKHQFNIFNNIFERGLINGNGNEESEKSESQTPIKKRKIREEIEDSDISVFKEEIIHKQQNINNDSINNINNEPPVQCQTRQIPIQAQTIPNNGNLGFLNDPNLISSNCLNFLNNQKKPVIDFNSFSNPLTNLSTNNITNNNSINNPTFEFITMIEKIYNQIAMSQLVNKFHKSMVQQTFSIVEEYTNQFSEVLKHNETFTDNLINLIGKYKNQALDDESQPTEISEEMKSFLEFQKINNSSGNLLNLLKNIMVNLKKQNENLAKNQS